MNEKRENGINVDSWTLPELQQVVEEFKDTYKQPEEGAEDQPKEVEKEVNDEDDY